MKRWSPVLAMLMVFMCLCACRAESIAYAPLDKKARAYADGDVSARAVMARRGVSTMNGGIKCCLQPDGSGYCFRVQWTNASECYLYGEKLLAGKVIGQMVPEEFAESGTTRWSTAYAADGWMPTLDTAMALTVTLHGDMANVTMSGDLSGGSVTLHYDLSRPARQNGVDVATEPVSWRGGALEMTLRGGDALLWAVDESTFAGETFTVPDGYEETTGLMRDGQKTESTDLNEMEQGKINHGYYVDDGVCLSYQLYLPENFDPEGSYPFILYLHGDGSRAADEPALVTNDEFTICRRIIAQKRDCVIFAPQTPVAWIASNRDLPGGRADGQTIVFDSVRRSRYLDMALDFAETLQARLPVDAARVYLYGYSKGAMAAWYLLADAPGRYAAAILCAGLGSPEKAETLKRTPLYIFHGDKDDVVSFRADRITAEAVREAGGEVVFKVCAGMNHGLGAALQTDDEVIDWLFSHSKEGL